MDMWFPFLPTSRFLKGAGVVVWGLMVGAGFLLLTEYQNAPGEPAQAPTSWPDDSRIPLAEDRTTLLVFAHPHCPCTDATMSELRRLVRHAGEQMRVHAVFLQPSEMEDAWTESALWNRANAIPGVRVWRDRAGRETNRFGVATSGQVLLYDSAGDLRFQGGVTGARGHEGDNAGRTALRKLLNEQRPLHTETFVFGCSMREKGVGICTAGLCLR